MGGAARLNLLSTLCLKLCGGGQAGTLAIGMRFKSVVVSDR